MLLGRRCYLERGKKAIYILEVDASIISSQVRCFWKQKVSFTSKGMPLNRTLLRQF